jgi:hypothetical protein
MKFVFPPKMKKFNYVMGCFYWHGCTSDSCASQLFQSFRKKEIAAAGVEGRIFQPEIIRDGYRQANNKSLSC